VLRPLARGCCSIRVLRSAVAAAAGLSRCLPRPPRERPRLRTRLREPPGHRPVPRRPRRPALRDGGVWCACCRESRGRRRGQPGAFAGRRPVWARSSGAAGARACSADGALLGGRRCSANTRRPTLRCLWRGGRCASGAFCGDVLVALGRPSRGASLPARLFFRCRARKRRGAQIRPLAVTNFLDSARSSPEDLVTEGPALGAAGRSRPRLAPENAPIEVRSKSLRVRAAGGNSDAPQVRAPWRRALPAGKTGSRTVQRSSASRRRMRREPQRAGAATRATVTAPAGLSLSPSRFHRKAKASPSTAGHRRRRVPVVGGIWNRRCLLPSDFPWPRAPPCLVPGGIARLRRAPRATSCGAFYHRAPARAVGLTSQAQNVSARLLCRPSGRSKGCDLRLWPKAPVHECVRTSPSAQDDETMPPRSLFRTFQSSRPPARGAPSPGKARDE